MNHWFYNFSGFGWFICLWCAVSFFLSWFGGWRRLAKSYPGQREPSGTRFAMQSGKVGQVSYSGCLIIYSSGEGLYISVLWLFRLGHPPLFIPWAVVQNVTTRRFLWIESVVFEVGSPSIATLQLPKKIFEGQNILPYEPAK